MEIGKLLQPLINQARGDVTQLLDRLQVGQRLLARVIDMPAVDTAKLRIGTTELMAHTRVSLPAGARLLLQVEKAGVQPQLKILDYPLELPGRQLALRTALAQLLPAREVAAAARQLKLEPGQGNAATAPKGAEPMPSAARDALRVLTQPLLSLAPGKPMLTSQAVRDAVTNSGIFLEARLAQGQAPAGDHKLQLLQFLRLLAPAGETERTPAGAPATEGRADQAQPPPQPTLIDRLVRLLEGSIARIQLQQAVALPGDDPSGRVFWQLELPLQLREELGFLQLRVEREGGREDPGAEPRWQVSLAFDFEALGEVESRVRLAGEQVAVTFWCERRETHRLFEDNLPLLENALLAAGLKPGHLASVNGKSDTSTWQVQLPEKLVDIHA